MKQMLSAKMNGQGGQVNGVAARSDQAWDTAAISAEIA